MEKNQNILDVHKEWVVPYTCSNMSCVMYLLKKWGKSFSQHMDEQVAKGFSGFQDSSFCQHLQTCRNFHNNQYLTAFLCYENPDQERQFIGVGQIHHPVLDDNKQMFPYIVNVTINPQFRLQGFGGEIIKLLEKMARKKSLQDPFFRRIRLNIDEDRLRHFYEPLGYREVLGLPRKTFEKNVEKYSKPSSSQKGGVRLKWVNF